MRQLSLLVVMVFAASSFVPLVAAEAPSEQAPRHRLHGDPLRLADPADWIPVFEETGSMAQAMQAAAASIHLTYSLYPLGDANGDGVEDILVENQTSTETDSGTVTESVVRAVSGRDYSTIWKIEVGDDLGWFVLGDVDGNGVEDIVLRRITTTGDFTGEGLNGVYLTRSDAKFRFDSDVISGTKGTVMFPLTCEGGYVSTWASASAAVAGGSFRDSKYTYCFLDSIEGSTGVDVAWETFSNSRGVSASAFIAGATLRSSAEEMRIIRHNAAGQPSWEWKLQRDNAYVYAVADEDFTGDGVPDMAYLLGGESLGYFYSPAAFQWIPSVVDPELGMVDGKTGRTTWTLPLSKDAWYTDLAVAGSLRGPGSVDLILSEFSQGDAPLGDWQAELRQINGATGATITTKILPNRIAMMFGHDDVDQDGRDEMILIQAKVAPAAPLEEPEIDETLEFSVVKSDMTTVWGPMAFGDEDDWWQTSDPMDLNGDGVQDLRFVHFEHGDEDSDSSMTYRFVSGSTGAQLWDYVSTPDLVSMRVVEDVDGTPGDDVAFTLFDLPDPAPRPSPSSSGSSSMPATPSAEPRRNYANHTGTLELRRGTDRELIWQKQIHDPKEVQNVTAQAIYSSILRIPDTNGDGRGDLLFSLQSPRFAMVSSDGDVLLMEELDSGLEFALLISGADGKTLQSYPDAKAKTPAVIGRAARLPAAGRPAQADGAGIPAPGLAILVAGLGAIALLRRRQA